MSLGCAVGCGRCCDPVELGPGVWATFIFWAPGGPWETLPDPAVDWEPWGRVWEPDAKEATIARYRDPDDPVRVNARFAFDRWHPRPEPLGRLMLSRALGIASITKVDCDAFDKVHRICTAHTDRPPICSNFPWYDFDPAQAVANADRPLPYPRAVIAFDGGVALACSYVVDLPPEARAGLRPQIPITPVHR